MSVVVKRFNVLIGSGAAFEYVVSEIAGSIGVPGLRHNF